MNKATYEKRERNIAHVARMTGSHGGRIIDDIKSSIQEEFK